ncbi:uncharacterized protein [Antedon mediterranea]|uniref:uncharacterized protein n=1 Tax=Antedon mediterranea TaxID=105859 RepID=UPI003AF7A7DE
MAKMPTKSSLIVLVIWLSGCMGQNVSPKVDLKSTTTTPKLCYRSACYLQPAKCNPEDGNCRYALSVKETSDKKSFKFNLRGSADGFVAVGLSKDKFVGSDDMVACVLNETKVQVKHIYGEYSRLHVDDLIEGATILKATYDRKNKMIHCVFTRKKILKSVPQYFNMKRKWYLIFASGALKKGMPLMQGPQRVTKRKVSLAKHVLYAETDIKPAGKPKTDKLDKGGSTDPFQPPDFLKLNKCGKYEQCAKVPDDCDWNKCDISVRIKENKTGDSLTFLLAGKSNGWIALAFSEDKKMNEDDVVFCIRGKTEGRTDVKQAYSARHYMEEITSPDNLMVHSSSYVDGYISCKFTRKKNIPENDKTFNLYRPHYMFLGYGPITSSIHRPMQHSVTPVISEYMVNFNSSRGVITMTDGSDGPDGGTGPLPFGAWPFDIDEDSGLPAASQEFVDPPNLQLIPDKAVISYKPTVPSTYMKYVRALSMFLPDSSAHATCNPATKFGYASGCPCVIITFTGNPKEWAPLPYLPMLIPTTIKDVYVDSHLPLTCEGKTNADKRILGSVVVTPSAGFLSDDLVNSFVTVQMMSPVENVSIRIVCFTWAANIDHSRSEGRINFTVKIKGSAKH